MLSYMLKCFHYRNIPCNIPLCMFSTFLCQSFIGLNSCLCVHSAEMYMRVPSLLQLNCFQLLPCSLSLARLLGDILSLSCFSASFIIIFLIILRNIPYYIPTNSICLFHFLQIFANFSCDCYFKNKLYGAVLLL